MESVREIKFPKPPEKLGLFFAQDYKRYRVAYGGRASGKSWAAVEGLIIRALQKPIRILCCREYQITIRDSIKKAIEDSVNRFGLSPYFTFTESEIRCYNGSVFMFRGLHNNVSEIKSLENISIAYVEEAESVSENSWNTLIPTIRAPQQVVTRYKDSSGSFGTLSGSASGGSTIKPAYVTAEPVGNTVTAQAVTPSADGSSSTNDGQPVTVLWNFELPVQSTETEQEV